MRIRIVGSSGYLMRGKHAQESGGRGRLIDETRSCFVRCFLRLKMLVGPDDSSKLRLDR